MQGGDTSSNGGRQKDTSLLCHSQASNWENTRFEAHAQVSLRKKSGQLLRPGSTLLQQQDLVFDSDCPKGQYT